VSADVFAERLAKVRNRFKSALPGNIAANDAALPQLAESVEAVAETYRRLHGMAGTGPTIGFAATGQAARAAENVLIEAYRGARALTSDETASLKEALVVLRDAAQSELQTESPGG